ncbi:unnamed protein product [Schistosoma curassoni]|uniref:Uncharacterized protein n=1 Tax=Schistosoma curassoni TaxID=6186 RepID=A0A183L4M0_9TREM|nr:unnamed protein product [Schistosoma curassoni]
MVLPLNMLTGLLSFCVMDFLFSSHLKQIMLTGQTTILTFWGLTVLLVQKIKIIYLITVVLVKQLLEINKNSQLLDNNQSAH